jgi:hypothetical protein
MGTPAVVLILGLVLAIVILFLVVIPKLDRAIRRRYDVPRVGEGKAGAADKTS